MALPKPKFPLDGACSISYNNTLYSYTHQAFQSLPLEEDAFWTQLPMGVAVKGGVCVKATPSNESSAALYIVGGASNSSDYPGLQRYTFASGEWETIFPTVSVTQNRLYHGAIYLNASDTILIYAGTQDNTKQWSTQTFTVQASEPYMVFAFQSIAPPAINPMLVPWSQNSALYIGGSTTNTRAMIFDPTTSWLDSNVTLAAPFYNTSNIKAVMAMGDDLSKMLYTFDMSLSPNAVNRTILVDGRGNAIKDAKPVEKHQRARSSPPVDKKVRKSLTMENWPAYNASLVSSLTRSEYSLAQDPSGLVVVLGGSDSEIICIFETRDNCWENATERLSSKTVTTQNVGLGPSVSTSPTPSPTKSTAPSATLSPELALTESNSNAPFPVKILGAVLGSILGLALVIIILMLLWRWQKKRRFPTEAGYQRRSSGFTEKNGMDFMDREPPGMVFTRTFPEQQRAESQGSFSSMAILLGRVGRQRGEKKSSNLTDAPAEMSQAAPVNTERPAAAGEDSELGIGAQQNIKRQRSRRRSSGWGRYWSGGSGGGGIGSRRTTYDDSDQDLTDSGRLPSHISAMPPPLKVGDKAELYTVRASSPTITYQGQKHPPSVGEMSGEVGQLGFAGFQNLNLYSNGPPETYAELKAPIPKVSTRTHSLEAAPLPMLPSHVARGPAPARPPPPPSSDMSWLNLGANARI